MEPHMYSFINIKWEVTKTTTMPQRARRESLEDSSITPATEP